MMLCYMYDDVFVPLKKIIILNKKYYEVLLHM